MAARDHKLALGISRGVVNLDGNGRDGGNNQRPNVNPPAPAPMNGRAPVNNQNAPVRRQGTFGGFGNNNNHQAPMTSQTPTNTRASPSNLLPPVQAAAVPPPPPGYGRGTFFGFGRNNHPSPRMSPASSVTSQASVKNHQAPVNGTTPDNRAAPSKVAAQKKVPVSNQVPANRRASLDTQARTSGRPLAEQPMTPGSHTSLVPQSSAADRKSKASDMPDEAEGRRKSQKVSLSPPLSGPPPTMAGHPVFGDNNRPRVRLPDPQAEIRRGSLLPTSAAAVPPKAAVTGTKRNATKMADAENGTRKRPRQRSPSPPPPGIPRTASVKRWASEMSDGTQVKSGVESKKRKVTEDVESVECCTCSEEFKLTEVMVAPCGDKYCRSCISRSFRLTLKDQSRLSSDFAPRKSMAEL